MEMKAPGPLKMTEELAIRAEKLHEYSYETNSGACGCLGLRCGKCGQDIEGLECYQAIWFLRGIEFERGRKREG